ncbi:MAG: hypothetical protein FJ290_07010 [Planctomycetes bacterium]|nr:hypothetical protein [Planctomycetota bacterium]
MKFSNALMRTGLVWAGAMCWLAAAAAEAPSAERVRAAVEEAVRSGACDLRVASAIQKLPRDLRPPLAARLADSAHPAMRNQAVLILRAYPPQVAGEAMRKLFADKDRSIQTAAALYLATESKDPEARALLLKAASDQDPQVAAQAVGALGSLGGPGVADQLLKLLQNKATPKAVRFAAILAAGETRAAACTPALLALLDDREPGGRHPGDTVRLCDMAAYALERIHQVNHMGAPDFYATSPVAKRDEGIALWKAWAAKEGGQAGPESREAYLGRLIEESLRTLLDSPDEEARKGVRTRLEAAFKMTLCLGDLPGVDAVVAPSVRDLWRILRVTDEGSWGTLLNSWHSLQLAFRAKLVPKEKASAPDRQALAFLLLAEGAATLPRVWVWSFSRNFGEVFPKSGLVAQANEIKTRLEAQFRKERQQVVLHGHIAVLEPLPKPPDPHPSMVPSAATAIWMNLSQEPSNWARHRAAVEHCRATKSTMRDYPAFSQQSTLYRGSEYPFLGSAAYQWRVRNDPRLALAFADKALVLNPGNPKAYALRGMIRVAAGDSPEAALADLMRAVEMDPASLGDEPETLKAAAFLVEKTLAAGDKAAAQQYLRSLGDLKPFRADQALKATAEFRSLLQRASAPAAKH